MKAWAAALPILLLATGAQAADPLVTRGARLARERCAPCHAVAAEASSPEPAAPAFRDLNQRYPVADLIGAIAEGASTGHPRMPRFRFSHRDRRALVAYVRSVQR